ncbi:hypothetical protein BDV98DRAFT_575490 [Pterulicium gracile]|uniref:Uncharacterized protein n=1 Tax=Pterulicium gracile TaxID=1884261 RepID=A0A5C3Q4T4_9AGAR|nr:hypothetical protein BDV98DRAFT_575490 [Pterula gracilis]
MHRVLQDDVHVEAPLIVSKRNQLWLHYQVFAHLQRKDIRIDDDSVRCHIQPDTVREDQRERFVYVRCSSEAIADISFPIGFSMMCSTIWNSAVLPAWISLGIFHPLRIMPMGRKPLSAEPFRPSSVSISLSERERLVWTSILRLPRGSR